MRFETRALTGFAEGSALSTSASLSAANASISAKAYVVSPFLSQSSRRYATRLTSLTDARAFGAERRMSQQTGMS